MLDDILKQDVSAPAGMFERCEARLFERISRLKSAEPWELYLKKDVPGTHLDLAEKELFKKIGPKPFVFFPTLFSSVAFSLLRNNKVIAGVVGTVVACCILAGIGYFGGKDRPVDSVVTTIQSGRATAPPSLARESETLQSLPGQRLVLSNRRARIIIENGASLELKKTGTKNMVCQVGFKDPIKNKNARVVFFVKKQKSTEQFTVETRGYSISVVGTAFGVSPGIEYHFTTKVYEGTVRIIGPAAGETSVSAGKAFFYDSRTAKYAVLDIDTMRKGEGTPPAEPALVSVKKEPAVSPPGPAEKAAVPHDSLLEKAVRLETVDWKKAIDCYNAILTARGGSEYLREISLFSIARLHADNNTGAAETRGAFESYLKRFPSGNFTGESYMRLAELEFKNNPRQSLSWYLRYIREFPAAQNTAGAEYKAGIISLQIGERKKAVEMLSSALAHAKTYPADKVAAIKRALDNAKSVVADSGLSAKQ